MARINLGILVSALALGTGGCIAQGRVSGQMEATAEPMLVEINPGVWVIEDYSEPVFYVDGFYWLYRDDVWFRSSYYTGGWARVQSAPQVVVSIQQPTAYVHYRAASGARVRSGPRGNVIVRGHDEDRSAPHGQPSDNRDIRSPRPDERMPAPQPPDRPRATPQDEGQNRREDKPDKQDKQDTRGNKPDKQDKQDTRGDKPDKQDTRGDKPDKPDKRDDKQRGNQGDQHKHP